jgi:hypothetical protein
VSKQDPQDVTLNLSFADMLTLARLVRGEYYKAQRERVKNIKSGWKPQPGRKDMSLVKLQRAEAIGRQLDDWIKSNNPSKKEQPHG